MELKVGKEYKYVEMRDFNDFVNHHFNFNEPFDIQKHGYAPRGHGEAEFCFVKPFTEDYGDDYIFDENDIENVEELLDEACRRGLMEPGNYVIHIWW